MLVIDASAILAWCFVDERPRNADALLARFEAEGLIAPAHWSLELTNILWMAQRKGRVTPDQVLDFLELVEGLGVEVDPETSGRAWVETRALAMADNLTTYDAAYLELAMRRGLALASKDADLLKAARRQKVSVINVAVSRCSRRPGRTES